MRLLLALLLVASPLAAQTVVSQDWTCDGSPCAEDPVIDISGMVSLPEGQTQVLGTIVVEVEAPPPPGETDFLQLALDHGGAAWSFADAPGEMFPTVNGCTGTCAWLPDPSGGPVSFEPGGIDGDGAVRFDSSGGVNARLKRAGFVMAGLDNGGPITIMGFAHLEPPSETRHVRLFSWLGKGPGWNGMMLVATGQNPRAILQAYTGYDPGDGGGYRSWVVRESVEDTVPREQTFCFAVSWSPGEEFQLYVDGVEVAYGGQFNAVLSDRGSGPVGSIQTGNRLTGWMDRLYSVQLDLSDEQIAEFCAQGGWQ